MKIEVLGQPPTSGTRDAFAELAMEGGCKTFKWLKDLKKEFTLSFKKADQVILCPIFTAGENIFLPLLIITLPSEPFVIAVMYGFDLKYSIA